MKVWSETRTAPTVETITAYKWFDPAENYGNQ